MCLIYFSLYWLIHLPYHQKIILYLLLFRNFKYESILNYKILRPSAYCSAITLPKLLDPNLFSIQCKLSRFCRLTFFVNWMIQTLPHLLGFGTHKINSKDNGLHVHAVDGCLSFILFINYETPSCMTSTWKRLLRAVVQLST